LIRVVRVVSMELWLDEGTEMRGIQDVLSLAAGGSYLLVVVELQESASSDLHNDRWIRAWIMESRRANRIASIIANKRKCNYKHRTVVFYSTHYLNKPEDNSREQRLM
jgi:hypothetical protein